MENLQGGRPGHVEFAQGEAGREADDWPVAEVSDEGLVGKAAVVTGGTQGIGQGIAERLASLGANVVVCARRAPTTPPEPPAAPPARGGQIVFEPADVRRAADVQRLVEACLERFGRLDVFVANAGIDIGGSLLELDEQTWDEVLDVNLKGAFLCTQAAARTMIRTGTPGRIVLIASTNAFWAESNLAPYNASKAGLVALARTAALELAPYAITVNAIGPGMIATPMTRPLLDNPRSAGEYLKNIPLGRYGTPADVAAAVAFLASDQATWITGQHLVVDGGQTAGLVRTSETINT
jgi:glucose 1-dehydrogenase